MKAALEGVPVSERYQTSKVTISKGTKFIEVQDVIGWIVNKISPLSDEPETLIHFKKCIQRESGNELLALSSDDYALLAIIFEPMPMGETFPYGLTCEEFSKYREVFETSSNKPDWTLHVEFQNKKLLSQQRQQLTAKTHIALIEQANKEKEITILSDALVPIGRAAYASVISIRDAKNYLSTYGIRLVKTDKAEELMKTGLYRLHDYGLLQANQVEVQAIAEPSASNVGKDGDFAAPIRRHSVKTRQRELDAEIKQAKEIATDGNDYFSVFTALCGIAREKKPPFTGVVSNLGIQYIKNDGEKKWHFSKEALKERMRRNAQKPQK